MRDFIRTMPKAELHVHLEGTTRPQTLLEMARRNHLADRLPTSDVGELERWFRFTDFQHFVRVINAIADLFRTPEDYTQLAYECGEEMAALNIRYRELTFTPFTHTHLFDKGLTFQDIFAGLEVGRARARSDFGVEMRWVFDIPRSVCFPQDDGIAFDPLAAATTLEDALQARTSGVVGFGLGGFEVNAPPEPFAEFFRAARNAGLLSVPHAGENDGPASVWGALTALQADRIGHGVRSAEDGALLQVLKERRIPLEVSLTSNLCLHVYATLAQHPFRALDRMGLVVTLNSDDPALFGTNLNQEYELLEQFGYDRQGIARIARNGFLASGAEPPLKSRLLAEFDAWMANALGT